MSIAANNSYSGWFLASLVTNADGIAAWQELLDRYQAASQPEGPQPKRQKLAIGSKAHAAALSSSSSTDKKETEHPESDWTAHELIAAAQQELELDSEAVKALYRLGTKSQGELEELCGKLAGRTELRNPSGFVIACVKNAFAATKSA
jgi:hypothetical protein